MKQNTCALIEGVSKGDDTAITHLLFLNYDLLIRYVQRLVPGRLRSEIDPEDVLQEAFVVAWQKIGSATFENKASFSGWLTTIVRRKLLDKVRACNRRKRSPHLQDSRKQCFASPTIAELAAATARSASSILAGNEAELRLRIAVCELSERHRRVLEFRYFDGLSPASIAHRMNCSVGAVHMLTGRAMQRLQQKMGRESNFFTIK